ncbi:alkane 1-monooxygenase [Namhaeicola litoreus]|uniref:Alkane 1-monooxygenase n=1 Tax=Namhaeicola litoreus TaxID=1052145 RepID=A0ABW3Y2I1_9FLAO
MIGQWLKDLKYLAAYINPALAVFGLYAGGIWSFTNVIFVFLMVPLIDHFSKNNPNNLSEDEKVSKGKQKYFDWILYFNLPILLFVILLFGTFLDQKDFSLTEIIGNTWSVGIVVGTCGINVGHELGHRKSNFDQLMAQLLLTPALYTHFFVEHNRGHHKYVATSIDPATAQKGEILYFFWFKSILKSYMSAWNIQLNLLNKKNLSFLSFKNTMLNLTFLMLFYLIVLLTLFSFVTVMIIVCSGIIGVLLLETINYLEHYGLRRNTLPNAGFERVKPKHSWNANFNFGRIVLYELTRHSDHHFLASKKYQLLDNHEDSPQLPYGYPAMMLVALIPPLWFKIMNPRLPN